MSVEPQQCRAVVKPRKPTAESLPIIAVTRTDILIESTGETYPIEELPGILVSQPSSIIVGEAFREHFSAIDQAFIADDTFQYRLTPVMRRRIVDEGEPQKATVTSTICGMIGWPGHWHHPLDPTSFIRMSIGEIDNNSEDPMLIRLLRWGQNVRRFCVNNELKISASAGGLARQLLRDPRFYPKARRKVPNLVNEKVRVQLPGNYYKLFAETHRRYSASYIDMENSHHAIASELEFPCADTLHAYGRFGEDDHTEWASHGTKRFSDTLKCAGLFKVRLAVPPQLSNAFPPPYMEKRGIHTVWIYSNEIPMIQRLGGRIEAIYAAIVSNEVETGLNRYAQFAIDELKNNKTDRPWLKPVLHSVYGVTAARPHVMEFGWRRAKGSEPGHYPMGNKMIPINIVRGNHPVEVSVVNVIHRGLIESEQRVRALQLARDLHRAGGQVLCIYADSLFVVMPQLPLLGSPWRLKEQVTQLRFLSATQFMSPQITRLPGVPREMQASFGPAGKTRSFRPERKIRPGNNVQCLDSEKTTRKVINGNNRRPDSRKGLGDKRGIRAAASGTGSKQTLT